MDRVKCPGPLRSAAPPATLEISKEGTRKVNRVGVGIGVAAVVWAAVLTAPAFGATRYAAPGATGPEPCATANPCEIEDAVEGTTGTEVEEGDSIVLRPGIYALGTRTLEMGAETSVGGVPGRARPTIRSSSSAIYGWAIAATPLSTGTRLHDVNVVETETGGLTSAVRFVELVERVSAVSTGHDSIGCIPAYNGLLRDSICRASGTDAVGISIQVGCSGLSVEPPVRIRNLNAIATGTDSVAIMVSGNGGCDLSLTGRNVVAQGDGTDLLARSDSAPGTRTEIDLDYSAFDHVTAVNPNEIASAPGSAANITAPPVFVGAASGDFRQAPSSPTIDAGSASVLGLGSFDLDGGPRSVGTAPDIGADEYDPPDTTAPDTSLTESPPAKLRSKKRRKKVGFGFGATEPASFECKLDRKPWAACESPRRAGLKAKRGRGKRHAFRVRAIDLAGHTDASPALWRGRVKRIG